ncbi:MAG: carbamate kinase [Thermoleophilia bacterium]|nr:carbamate kinase [Thermoleophilia bacterium]MDQ3858915.1 carbamate kinase [Actinomycetota bacterium]
MPSSRGLTVVALGGNALLRAGERGTAAEQRANLAETFATIAPLLSDGPLVVTHGNGPQVGNELLRQELASAEAPPLPLYLAVAQTQAEIGALIAAELPVASGRSAVVLLTRVVVDEGDPAFAAPTKPVGPFYDEPRARELERERGWALVEDAGRGWRRVVPSPRPLEVVELEGIRTIVASGTAAVAVGGGGIPVVRRDGRYDGVDAVIDKDLASALAATGLAAERLLILTQVPAVFRDYDAGERTPIGELRPGRDDAILADLPAGSMRPKVDAAFAFVRETGGEALITSADALKNAEAGTRIVPASAP